MKYARVLAFLAACFLLSCQAAASPTVTIIDNNEILTLQTDERLPSLILKQAGITLRPADRLLINGLAASMEQPIPAYPVTLQVRRATSVTVITPEGEQELETAAFTVGEALQQASIWLHANDAVEPGIHAPLSTSTITLQHTPIHDLTITSGAQTFQTRSSSATVGEALAEAGIPLIGLDYSLPSEDQPLPADGQIRVVRVSESMQLAQKPIPFESELQASADVPLDQTQILQPGETGLTVQRIRIRYEDGEEVARITEDETTVRPPRTRLLGYGTKIEVKSAVVDGVNIEYWRAVQMYATSYSPCRSGADRCYSGTSSGKSLRKGMVGLRYSWYLSMQGQQLYIPGYGFASVEDVCGGCVGQPWIDLGFSDQNFEPWHSWVTVYFLTPVPANVIYVLE